MTEQEIARINELYHKSKAEGLTEDEKLEQADLRIRYIESIRKNLKENLKSVRILEPDGTVTDMRKVIEGKERGRH